MRVALRFAYDGRGFHGYARQPNVRTVEGEILNALDRIKARHIRFSSSSRTDRGVSALGNVIAFDTNFRPSELPSALNANLEDIYFTGYSEVPLDFNPRHAKLRWYRYHLSGEHRIDALRESAAVFVGKHDFSGFSRPEKERSPVREISDISIEKNGRWTFIDFRAQSFLWQMVRRIVGAMLSFEEGNIDREELAAALDGKWLQPRIAPPEPLFLMGVSYDKITFTDIDISGSLAEKREDALLTLRFLDYIP